MRETGVIKKNSLKDKKKIVKERKKGKEIVQGIYQKVIKAITMLYL